MRRAPPASPPSAACRTRAARPPAGSGRWRGSAAGLGGVGAGRGGLLAGVSARGRPTPRCRPTGGLRRRRALPRRPRHARAPPAACAGGAAGPCGLLASRAPRPSRPSSCSARAPPAPCACFASSSAFRSASDLPRDSRKRWASPPSPTTMARCVDPELLEPAEDLLVLQTGLLGELVDADLVAHACAPLGGASAGRGLRADARVRASSSAVVTWSDRVGAECAVHGATVASGGDVDAVGGRDRRRRRGREVAGAGSSRTRAVSRASPQQLGLGAGRRQPTQVRWGTLGSPGSIAAVTSCRGASRTDRTPWRTGSWGSKVAQGLRRRVLPARPREVRAGSAYAVPVDVPGSRRRPPPRRAPRSSSAAARVASADSRRPRSPARPPR